LVDPEMTSLPLIISTAGKKPESVIVWARTDVKVKDERGLFVKLDGEAGARRTYQAQRFEVFARRGILSRQPGYWA
jgi:hypothetical protein